MSLSAKEVARELMDELENDNGCLFGDVTMFNVLVATVQQAMDLGWGINAEHIVVMAVGGEADQAALVEQHPALSVVGAQLNFIFNSPAQV